MNLRLYKPSGELRDAWRASVRRLRVAQRFKSEAEPENCAALLERERKTRAALRFESMDAEAKNCAVFQKQGRGGRRLRRLESVRAEVESCAALGEQGCGGGELRSVSRARRRPRAARHYWSLEGERELRGASRACARRPRAARRFDSEGAETEGCQAVQK